MQQNSIDGDEMGVNKTYGKVRPKISRQSKISKADTDDSMYDGPTADSKGCKIYQYMILVLNIFWLCYLFNRKAKHYQLLFVE